MADGDTLMGLLVGGAIAVVGALFLLGRGGDSSTGSGAAGLSSTLSSLAENQAHLQQSVAGLRDQVSGLSMDPGDPSSEPSTVKGGTTTNGTPSGASASAAHAAEEAREQIRSVVKRAERTGSTLQLVGEGAEGTSVRIENIGGRAGARGL